MESDLTISTWVRVQSFKHDGSLHRTWDNMMVVAADEDYVITGSSSSRVVECDGRIWYTKEPAISIYSLKHWFNVIAMMKGKSVVYYVNIASPSLIDQHQIKYIDYDLDLRVFPDGSFKVLDRGEYKYHKSIMNYSDDLDMILKSELTTLINMVRNKDPMFNKETIEKYNHIYNEMKQKMKK